MRLKDSYSFMELISPTILGGIIPNVVAFIIFCLLIIYFAKTGKMSTMLGWNKNK